MASFSPLLDVIMNAFCAMAIIVFVLAMMINPPREKLRLVHGETVESSGTLIAAGRPEKDSMTGRQDSKQVSFVSVPPDTSLPRITTDALPVVVAGQPISFAFSGEGGVGNYSWRFEGQLPPKLQWTSSGFAGTLDSSVGRRWQVAASNTASVGESHSRGAIR